jgi:tRNA nucleotidyltransferase (CCA-adding enzyme)
MRRSQNLTAEIKTQLPAELVSFLDQAGRLAGDDGRRLYLVGGVVRDLLLHRPNFDLDLVVEGDAVPLARKLALILHADLTVHSSFMTAKLHWDKWNVDLTTARSEIYRKPGALPLVQPGSLMSDLYRRDFTINAMAVDLNPKRYGKLIDFLGGWNDLLNKQLRVMHNDSFVDDATRIWRAIRYEQRLNFHLEPVTLRLLKKCVSMLDTISGDRIKHELATVFREEQPERVLRRAARLGVLSKLHPSLIADGWLGNKFRQARRIYVDRMVPVELYYALLGYRLTLNEADRLNAYLSPPRLVSHAVTDAIGLKTRLDSLTQPGLSHSKIYGFIEEYPEVAVTANRIAAESPLIRRRLQRYLDVLRYVKPVLTGGDLKKMGVSPGPQMKLILRTLLEARLDGKVAVREDEVAIVREWLERGAH